jgi:hypothetical protein
LRFVFGFQRQKRRSPSSGFPVERGFVERQTVVWC